MPVRASRVIWPIRQSTLYRDTCAGFCTLQSAWRVEQVGNNRRAGLHRGEYAASGSRVEREGGVSENIFVMRGADPAFIPVCCGGLGVN